jgi:MscS family membrane protein
MNKKILLILSFLLFPLLLSAETVQIPPHDLSTPRKSMNYFLKTMKAHKLGDAAAIDLATKTLDLSKMDPTVRVTNGRVAAKNIINTLDRIEYINITNIPEAPKGNTWIYRKNKVEWEGEFYNVEISMIKDKDNQWKFSPATVSSIFYYYKSLQSQKIVKGVKELKTWKDQIKNAMPDWTGKRAFILLNGQWLGILAIIFIAFFIRFFLKFYIGRAIDRLFKKSSLIFNDKTRNSLSYPIGLATVSGVWSVGIGLLEFDDKVLSFLLRAGYVGFTVGTVITVYFLVDILKIYLEKLAKDSENKFDDILVPLVTKTLKTFVVLIGIIFIGNSLTLDMKGILAGMGIGGIAFALAAKDTISNIFGSLTVLLDRPFRIGDWVLIDGSIEGTIEEVGLRSTRIRTFYDSLISLPNGRLTNAHIDNYGQRTYRRLSTKIGVQYDTPPEKLEAFCEGIRQLIANHKYTRKDNFHVYFNSFGDSALEVLLYVFWKVPGWADELNEKHRLLMDILRLGNEMGVEFAFPTQTVHLFNGEARKHHISTMADELMKAKSMSKDLSDSTITYDAHRSSSDKLT